MLIFIRIELSFSSQTFRTYMILLDRNDVVPVLEHDRHLWLSNRPLNIQDNRTYVLAKTQIRMLFYEILMVDFT